MTESKALPRRSLAWNSGGDRQSKYSCNPLVVLWGGQVTISHRNARRGTFPDQRRCHPVGPVGAALKAQSRLREAAAQRRRLAVVRQRDLSVDLQWVQDAQKIGLEVEGLLRRWAKTKKSEVSYGMLRISGLNPRAVGNYRSFKWEITQTAWHFRTITLRFSIERAFCVGQMRVKEGTWVRRLLQ